MPWNNVTVQYYTGSTWTTLTNVVELSSTIGRQKSTDPFSPSSTTVRLRYPSGFASPLASLEIGKYLRWWTPNSSSSNPSWLGKIRDISAEWGVPYASNVGPDDYLVISAEGHLADWGRVEGNNFAVGSGFCNGATTAVANQFGLLWNGNITDEPIAASTVSGSPLQWLNQMANTAQARVIDGNLEISGSRPSIYVAKQTYFFDSGVTFTSAGGNNSVQKKYQQLAFDSLADNYYTQAQVESPGLATQTTQSGSAPYRTLVVDTYASSTSQMSGIASFVLGKYNQQVLAPTQLVAYSEGQQTNNLDTLGVIEWNKITLVRVPITFRGTTYYAMVEGAQMFMNANGARFTYYLTPDNFYAWLTLNDAQRGQLNNNKLALYP